MRRRSGLLLLMPLLALSLTVGMFMSPTSAAAHTAAKKFHGNPHMFLTQGRSAQSGREANLIYHGGPVVANTMRVYAIFWEPDGTFVGPEYNSLLLRYFNDIGGSSLYANNRQYTN